VLVVSPATVSYPITAEQLLLIAAGLAVVLVANIVLLRITLRPLHQLANLMERIDLLRPGSRLEVKGARELNVVLKAFNEMLERLERERQTSSSRTVDQQENERRQLANELHDEVGQGLTALLLQLKIALPDAPEPIREQLLEARRIARTNLDEVRRIVRQLRPTMLDDLGLPYALHSLADAAEEQGDVLIDRRIDSTISRLPDGVELAVYRIGQEALTNALRHADASRIEIVLEKRGDPEHLRLTVHDDGRGTIYVADVEGGGIRGMRERAITIGGELAVVSRPGEGTSILFSIPLGQ
jgi:two-component system, NarL family, sensor histidine kinase UhpB